MPAPPAPLPPREACRRLLRRRGWLLAPVLALALGAGWLTVRCRQPWYVAHVQVEVLPPAPPADAAAPAAPLSPADTAAVATVAEELGSPANVSAALDQLPPSQAAALTPPPVRSPAWLRRAWLRLRPQPADAAARTAAVLRHLSVRVADNSRLLSLDYTAPSPALAAAFLRSLTAAYLQQAAERQQAAARRRVAGLQAESAAARERVLAAAARLDQVARAEGLSDPAAQLAAAGQRWQQLSGAVTSAEVHAAEQGAALAQPPAPDPAAVPADLLVKRAQAAAEVRRLASIYQPEAAPRRQAEQQLAALDAGIRTLMQQNRDARQQALAAVRQETAALRRRLAAQAGDQAALQRRLAAFDLAQRPLAAERTAYSHLLDALQDAVASTADTPAPLVPTAPPSASPRALSPRLAPSLASALLAGLVLGLAAGWAWERADDRLVWPEAEEMGVGLAAALPQLPAAGADAAPEFAQALERCTAALLRAQADAGLHSLLICSPAAGEGKSTLALHLARRLAALGQSVLLLDGNARRPALAERLAAARRPGLAEVFAGEAALEAALHPQSTREARPAFIAAGAPAAGYCLHLASGGAADLLAAARARFDWVLVDGPAATESLEAGLWAGLTDSTWIVARHRVTRRAALRRTLSNLAAAGASHPALVINYAPSALPPGRPLWQAESPLASSTSVTTMRARA
jgi:uncharacterized protein involved in exopolysaccharide biosynthesis/Mrp family chromosome partitioning ATPase